MKSLFITLGLVITFVVGVGLLTKNVDNLRLNANLENKEQIKVVTINNKEIEVQVADTETERNKGLGGKDNLRENEGMLFVFEAENITPSFWMKDMKFPIDIIWIDDGKVVQVNENLEAPEANTPDTALKIYTPNQPIDTVLEVNTGFVKENSISLGDAIDMSPQLK